MKLTTAQLDRACGVLLGSAVGDALGAGYEFTTPAADLVPAMIGGGLGDFAPGEWTDDTSQAVAIAEVAATGIDLRSPQALTAVAQRFADWYADGPADVGVQTSTVLSTAGRTPTGESMAAAAAKVHARSGRSAGNGSLMRTGPVALAYLGDPEALVEAATAVSALTHYQDIAQQGCAVWCLLIRHAVLTGELPTFEDVAAWAPNADYWRDVLAEAENREPGEFVANGWVVGAMQAAWSAITHTSVPTSSDRFACEHLDDALTTAIRIGHDTDTVAAITGALLGARWGMTAIRAEWRRPLHGWPGITGQGLEKLAVLTVQGGRPGGYGWPLVEHIDYDGYGERTLVRHPFDDGVWLAGATELEDLPDTVDAVVSLCLVGDAQVPPHVEHITYRLIDAADPAENRNLDYLLADAARLVARLRDEGKQVLVHCVAAQSRTPAVGIAYALYRGVSLSAAMAAVCGALPAGSPNAGFRRALERLGSSRG